MEHVVRLTHGMDNVFDIDDADECRCQITMWATDIGAFGRIMVYCPKEASDRFQISYITLTRIEHFEGNVYWKGANFKSASREECDQYLAEHGLKREINFYPERYLLKTNRPDSVKIVTSEAHYYRNARTYHKIQDDQLLQRISTRYTSDGKPVVGIHRVIDTLKNGKEIVGTVTVEQILERLENGHNFESLLAEFHWLEPEDIQACLIYARQAVKKSIEK